MIQLLIIAYFLSTISGDIRTCQNYNQSLPSGVCLQYLNNQKIAESYEDALHTNKKIKEIFTITEFVNSLVNQNYQFLLYDALKIYAFFDCKDTRLAKLLREFDYPTINETLSCFEYIKKFICYSGHKLCITSYDNQTILSPPCFETCEDIKKIGTCKKAFTILKRLAENTHVCPRLLTLQNRTVLTNCEEYPHWKKSSIFNCQLNVLKSEKNIEESKTCYGQDIAYVGQINQTENKKSCLSWSNKSSILATYSLLQENYCRSIRSYNLKPWCYITDNGDWEYCDIPLCSKTTTKSNKSGQLLIWIVVVITLILIIIFILIIKRYMSKKKTAEMKELNTIAPYREQLLDSVGIEALINKTKGSSNQPRKI